MQLNRSSLISCVLALTAVLLAATSFAAETTVSSDAAATEPRAGRKFPSVALGLGGYFLEPAEVTNAASHSAVISVRPILVFRSEQHLPRFLGTDAWVLEPHFGVIFPQISSEDMATLTGIINFDLGYLVTDRLVPTLGVGVIPSVSISSAANVEVGGDFVTPGGTAWTWLFSNNAGVAYWVDKNLRLDVGTSVVRLFDDESRRFRYFIEVAYAF